MTMAKTIRLKNVPLEDAGFWSRFDNEEEYNEARAEGRNDALQYRDWDHYQKKMKALAYSDNHSQMAGNRANVPKNYRKEMDVSWRRKQNQKLQRAVKKGDEDEFSQDKHHKDAGYTYW